MMLRRSRRVQLELKHSTCHFTAGANTLLSSYCANRAKSCSGATVRRKLPPVCFRCVDIFVRERLFKIERTVHVVVVVRRTLSHILSFFSIGYTRSSFSKVHSENLYWQLIYSLRKTYTVFMLPNYKIFTQEILQYAPKLYTKFA